jgi:hypothetical protein
MYTFTSNFQALAFTSLTIQLDTSLQRNYDTQHQDIMSRTLIRGRDCILLQCFTKMVYSTFQHILLTVLVACLRFTSLLHSTTPPLHHIFYTTSNCIEHLQRSTVLPTGDASHKQLAHAHVPPCLFDAMLDIEIMLTLRLLNPHLQLHTSSPPVLLHHELVGVLPLLV